VADDAIEGFGDVVIGGLGPRRWGGFQVPDAAGGEEAFVVDAFSGFDVVEPVRDVVVDFGAGSAAGQSGFDGVAGVGRVEVCYWGIILRGVLILLFPKVSKYRRSSSRWR